MSEKKFLWKYLGKLIWDFSQKSSDGDPFDSELESSSEEANTILPGIGAYMDSDTYMLD